MTHQDTITISAKGFCDVVDVTDKVQKIVGDSGVKQGIVVVFVPGSTASVTTLEYEPHLVKDLQEFMEQWVPSNKSYRHGEAWGDDNGFSHLRSALLGPSVAVPISDGNLTLGTWQQVVVVDFDNRARKREVVVKVIGE